MSHLLLYFPREGNLLTSKDLFDVKTIWRQKIFNILFKKIVDVNKCFELMGHLLLMNLQYCYTSQEKEMDLK